MYSDQLFSDVPHQVQEALHRLDLAISVFDRNLNLVFCNHAYRKLLDFPIELCRTGTPIAEFFRYNAGRGEYGPGDPDQQVQERIALAKRFEPLHFQRQRPNGTVIEISGYPVPDVGFVATYTDITERERAHAELRLAASVFDTQEGILITGPDERIIRINEAFTRITGYTADEVIGETPCILCSNRHGTEFFRAMWDAIGTRGRWQGEVWNRRKNGELFPEWLSISAVINEHGATTHYIGTFSDLTELHKQRAVIERTAKEERRYVAGKQRGGAGWPTSCAPPLLSLLSYSRAPTTSAAASAFPYFHKKRPTPANYCNKRTPPCTVPNAKSAIPYASSSQPCRQP